MWLWIEVKRCSFRYQNEEYKEEEWKESNHICMDSFEIKLKIRGLFIKL